MSSNIIAPSPPTAPEYTARGCDTKSANSCGQISTVLYPAFYRLNLPPSFRHTIETSLPYAGKYYLVWGSYITLSLLICQVFLRL